MEAPALHSPARAIAEVALVTAAYIAFAHLGLATVDLSSALPAFLSDREAQVGAGFLVGALAQLLFVAVAATIIPTMRDAIRATFRRAPKPAWVIALVAAAVQCITIIVFFLPDPTHVVELSSRHALLLPLPLADGWSQEVMFRGYILFRLSKANVAIPFQIALSALAFSSIHFGYIGSAGLGVLWPLVGTATLGGILAWSVAEGRGSILPAVVAHVVILIVVQPWLAMAA
jgi:hypothetical protein